MTIYRKGSVRLHECLKCLSQDVVMSWNRQTTDWEEIFSEHLLAKCWCPEYVKGRQLKRTGTPIKNGQEI